MPMAGFELPTSGLPTEPQPLLSTSAFSSSFSFLSLSDSSSLFLTPTKAKLTFVEDIFRLVS